MLFSWRVALQQIDIGERLSVVFLGEHSGLTEQDLLRLLVLSSFQTTACQQPPRCLWLPGWLPAVGLNDDQNMMESKLATNPLRILILGGIIRACITAVKVLVYACHYSAHPHPILQIIL